LELIRTLIEMNCKADGVLSKHPILFWRKQSVNSVYLY